MSWNYENSCGFVAPYLILVFHFQYVPFHDVSVYLGVTAAAAAAEADSADSDSPADSIHLSYFVDFYNTNDVFFAEVHRYCVEC